MVRPIQRSNSMIHSIILMIYNLKVTKLYCLRQVWLTRRRSLSQSYTFTIGSPSTPWMRAFQKLINRIMNTKKSASKVTKKITMKTLLEIQCIGNIMIKILNNGLITKRLFKILIWSLRDPASPSKIDCFQCPRERHLSLLKSNLRRYTMATQTHSSAFPRNTPLYHRRWLVNRDRIGKPWRKTINISSLLHQYCRRRWSKGTGGPL